MRKLLILAVATLAVAGATIAHAQFNWCGGGFCGPTPPAVVGGCSNSADFSQACNSGLLNVTVF